MESKLNMVSVVRKVECLTCKLHNESPRKVTINSNNSIELETCCEEFYKEVYEEFGNECVKQLEDQAKKLFDKKIHLKIGL